jgi:hypothetical protein
MSNTIINSKVKILLQRRIPACRQAGILRRKNAKLQVSAEGGSSFGGKIKN